MLAGTSRVRARVDGSAFSPVGVLRINDQTGDDDQASHDGDGVGVGGLAIFCRDAHLWEALAALCLDVRDQLVGQVASPVCPGSRLDSEQAGTSNDATRRVVPGVA